MQQEQPVNSAASIEEELSLKAVIHSVSSLAKYIRSKWVMIVIAAFVGALLGFAYANYKKPIYTASSTFVLEESGSGKGLSQYAGLASLAGIDLSGNGAGGIFQGDNILELYKSRLMIEKTLLSPVVIGGKQMRLIDRYVTFNNLKDKWEAKGVKNVDFSGDPATFSRSQDSIITDITELFNKKMLTVGKLDKKLSIIKVEVNSPDEIFAKEFNAKLVENVNSFYTLTKTKKSAQNIAVLQRQSDSVKRVLGISLSGVAAAIDAAPNANPAMVSLKVPSQKRQVDVQASSAIYGEIVKNLEISKISLRQETPLIQVIDQPVYPLPASRLGVVKGIVVGLVVGAMLVIFALIVRRVVQQIMS